MRVAALSICCAVAALACVACDGSGQASAPTTTRPEVAAESQARVRAALVPLSEMPAGTKLEKIVYAKDAVNCTPSVKPPAPLFSALGHYVEKGFRRIFDESVQVYAKGTSAQIMNYLRPGPRCSVVSATALRFPHITSDQVSLQLTSRVPGFRQPCRDCSDWIALRVNDSTVLFVTVNGVKPGRERATEAFVRMAYDRAKSKLGG